MNLASLANQKISATPLGKMAQAGFGRARLCKGWEGAGWAMWGVFLVEGARPVKLKKFKCI